MNRALIGIAVLALAGCSGLEPNAGFEARCTSDDQCAGSQLCFAEGCGDPGKNVVVEVTGSSVSSQYARDYSIANGTLGPTYDFALGDPLSITGQFTAASDDVLRPYIDAVMVRAVGQSALIPGVMRSFEARFDRPERGFFEMKVAAGDFTITATPTDRTVPPSILVSSVVPEGVPGSLAFTFPSSSATSVFAGQLVKRRDPSVVPPQPVLVSEAFLAKGQEVPTIELQVIDPLTGAPFSQRQAVASTSGEFAISVNPEARLRESITIIAAPRESGAPVPTKRFTLQTPLSDGLVLEYGDFGEAADVAGVVLDASGVAIAGAQVVLEGTVTGDGTFRSRVVETDANGHFTLSALASKKDVSFKISIVPPRSSRAANSERLVTVKVDNGVGTLEPSVLTLGDRLMAKGKVTKPGDHEALAGVLVRATLQLTAGTSPAIASEPAETTTDVDGAFTLALEPGVWRFEYTPGQMLPVSSRLVTLTSDPTGAVELKPVQLSYGRSVSGLISGTGARLDQPVPYAQVRFFRVTSVGGEPVSILLGTGIADERGRYTVVLPSAAASMIDAGR